MCVWFAHLVGAVVEGGIRLRRAVFTPLPPGFVVRVGHTPTRPWPLAIPKDGSSGCVCVCVRVLCGGVSPHWQPCLSTSLFPYGSLCVCCVGVCPTLATLFVSSKILKVPAPSECARTPRGLRSPREEGGSPREEGMGAR